MHAPAWSDDREFDLLVVGDLNIDLILSGVPRLPEYGEEVLATGLAQRLGGSAANFAVCCARLGRRVGLVANVGRDEFGDFLIAELTRAGVSAQFVGRHERLATGITVSLSGPSDRAFITYVGTIDSLEADAVPPELLARARHLHIASYFLQTRLQPGAAEVVRAAHAAGLSVSLDTGYDPTEQWDHGLLELLAEVDIAVPNEVEAQAITGTSSAEAALAVLGAMVRMAVVKIGPEGALGCDGAHTMHIPAFSIGTADTTGCGDAFNAGFIDATLAGLPLADALARGNACGALMASVVGVDPSVVSPEAVAAILCGTCATGTT